VPAVPFATRLAVCLFASLSSATIDARPAFSEPDTLHGGGFASKKGTPIEGGDDLPILGTLCQVHTGELLVVDARSPDQDRFDALMADQATGSSHAIDPELLGLLRDLAKKHPLSWIEIVSGYRSPKYNEMLRKKGHHVSPHSQHSLGRACDFRIVPPGEDRGLDPRVLAQEIRSLGWRGGIGVYPSKDDWFVHADVGQARSWVN